MVVLACGGRRGQLLALRGVDVSLGRWLTQIALKPREGPRRSAGGWLARCGPQAASRIAAKNSAHLFMHSLFIGHRAPQRARQAPWGGMVSKALVLTVFLRVRGWLGGACDTQSSEQKLQPVQTRTKTGNLSLA